MTIIFTIIAVIVAIIAFVITWIVSEFFIPPRDHWTKSGFAVLTIKIGMAATVAFYAFGLVYIFFGVAH